MSWEDVLKRGKVPKKPTRKETPDTGWKNKVPEKERIEFLPEPKNIVERIKQESEREALSEDYVRRERERQEREVDRRSRSSPLYYSDEARESDKRRQKWREQWAESERIKARKRAGTHRPEKGQKRNKNPRQQAPKKTRSQRKAANEAKANRKAKKERYAREDAARAERDRRRGL